jgi:serine/threonine-protein kinase HipA
MNRCPITYQICGNQKYSKAGLRLLSSRLPELKNFSLKQKEQLELALKFADKLSFSGVQSKLNARLVISQQTFNVVAKGGNYIIKPQSPDYPELPQNEDLTMKLADYVGISTPVHGLMHCNDGTLSYFIKRFDRKGRKGSIGVEDFTQVAGVPRETKYDYSMEKLVPIVEEQCTFPDIEKEKLFLITLFSFLIGNEDLHLKNFSLIHEQGVTQFSPAYDLVNSSILLNTKEELALTLRGKRSKLNRFDFVDYFGKEKLKLRQEVIDKILDRLQSSIKPWMELIQISFLSEEKKKAYLNLLEARKNRLFPE